MKKKFIIGLFSLLLLPCFGYCLDDGIYHNFSLGLISIVKNGNTIYTLKDKNLGATCTDVDSICSFGNTYSFGNYFPFSYSGFINEEYGLSKYTGSWDILTNTGVFIRRPMYLTGSYSLLTSYEICPSGFQLLSIPWRNFVFSLSFLGLSGTDLLHNYLLFPFSYYIDYDVAEPYGYYMGKYLSGGHVSSVFITDMQYLYEYPFGVSMSVRCFKDSVVNPDSSWVKLYSISGSSDTLTCDQLLAGGSVQGLLTFYETDTGSYWTITTGGISCRLINWTLSGDTVQIYSGTITLNDDYYIYSTSTGLIITTVSGNVINKGTWENLLTRFSGHQLTIYETDSGIYYTYVNDSGQIVNITVDEIFTYGISNSISGGNSINEITPNKYYGYFSDGGFHWFTCGVGKSNDFNLFMSDYYYGSDLIPKLDVNILGFVSCPFYSLIAGIKDNFNNSTLIGEYHPILNQTGFYHKGTLENKQRLFTFFDWIIIFILFVIFGKLFSLVSKKI